MYNIINTSKLIVFFYFLISMQMLLVKIKFSWNFFNLGWFSIPFVSYP